MISNSSEELSHPSKEERKANDMKLLVANAKAPVNSNHRIL